MFTVMVFSFTQDWSPLVELVPSDGPETGSAVEISGMTNLLSENDKYTTQTHVHTTLIKNNNPL